MTWLRFLSPFYVLRLERELAAWRQQREADRLGMRAFTGMIGRQAKADEAASLMARVVAAEAEVAFMRHGIHEAAHYLASGRVEHAARQIMALLAHEIEQQREAG